MKCEHLVEIPFKGRVKVGEYNTIDLAFDIENLLACTGKDKCPKKKQPCEINARCWRIG